MQEDYVEL